MAEPEANFDGVCGINRESGDCEAVRQEATDEVDKAWCPSATANPDAGAEWRVGSDSLRVVSGAEGAS